MKNVIAFEEGCIKGMRVAIKEEDGDFLEECTPGAGGHGIVRKSSGRGQKVR